MLTSATAIFDLPKTDLGTLFENYIMTNRAGPSGLGEYETPWLNMLRDRAMRINDARLRSLTNDMLELLKNPASAVGSFRDRFRALYMEAGHHAYPLTWTLKGEVQKLTGTAQDFTLNYIDLGLVRAMEDDALSDSTARKFVDEMLALLEGLKKKPHHQVMPGVFEVYSEALVYRLLKQRGGGHLTIRKIKESGPDFECVLRVGDDENARELTFYVEVKSFDVADAPQRLPEMADESLNANIDLERQLREGNKVATTTREIAPSKRYKAGTEYDSWSVRRFVEFLIDKASNNFKAEQFQCGPTFALLNVLRLTLPGQEANGLAPFFFDPLNGGACVSGILWHLAFGTIGAPIHRSPEFEGAPTVDGQLQRNGLLVDAAKALPAAGMIVLDHYGRQYRLDGLYDPRWTDKAHGWSDSETVEVFSVLCDGFNDLGNGMAHRYSRKP